MKLTFLGGADEIGASCTLVEMAGARILVDCGLRHHERAGERLPALAGIDALNEKGKLDAIILTHAHIDHSGALPVIAQSYLNTPIYLTAPTLGIVSVLLLDAVKIMEMGLQADGEIPLYNLSQIDNALAACRPVAFDSPCKIAADVELTFRPAGHILGAASALLQSSEGSIVMSGDIHAIDQLTVPGLIVPANKPDIFVIESTYGGKQHASRALEETRLIERIGKVIENKGSVIIPAFAVGRSQELILLVSRAIEQGKLPKVPIFVDGMVKSVCSVYSSYPELMTPWLKYRIKRKGNPFFHDGSPAVPVYDPKLRREVAKMRPAIIISSSGMVTAGSPSSFYAAELAKDARSLIAISGYQDEESPGRQMLELARKGGGKLPTANGEVELGCAIEAFSFSAHSDSYQVINELQAAQPRKVVLVHGDGRAREALAKELLALGFKDVHLPALGHEIEIAGKKEKRAQIAITQSKKTEVSNEETITDTVVDVGRLDNDNFFPLAEKLLQRDSTSRTYTVAEIMAAGGYQPEQITTEAMARVSTLLAAKNSPFAQDRKKKMFWRLRVLSGNRLWQPSMEIGQANIERMVREAFADEEGLYKVGVRLADKTLLLKFYFPKLAIARCADTVRQLEEKTGWRVIINTEPHQQQLLKEALNIVPNEWQPNSPSVRLDTETVTVKVEYVDAATIAQIEQEFKQKTGFTLVVQQASAITPTAATMPIVATRSSVEINTAYAMVRSIFAKLNHQPLKIGQKQGFIELTFITPEIGKRYSELIAVLEQRTGHSLRIRETPDQSKVQQTVKELIPKEWGIKAEPSINLSEKIVTVYVKSGLGISYKAQGLVEEFYQATGWKLVVKMTS